MQRSNQLVFQCSCQLQMDFRILALLSDLVSISGVLLSLLILTGLKAMVSEQGFHVSPQHDEAADVRYWA